MQSKSLELFTNFFAVVVAAYVGSFLASQSQGELWRKEKFYTMRMQILEKRHQLFKEMAENLNESARFAFLIGSGAKSDNDDCLKWSSVANSRN